MLTPAELAQRVGAKQVGKEYVCLCPVHEADGGRHKPSCAIAGGIDHPIVIICRSRGCDWKDILTAWGIPVVEVMNGNGAKAPAGAPTYYTYTDNQGHVVYRKKRTANKDFFFEKPDGRGGWITSKAQNDGRSAMDGVSRQIYRRHELAGNTEVFVAEGEKDADRLWTLGLPATTNDAGAKHWIDPHTAQLEDVTAVWILEDHDEDGRVRCQGIARSCTASGIRARIVRLPGLPPKGDVSDWLDAGHTNEQFLAECLAAPVWTGEATTASLVSNPSEAREPDAAPVEDLQFLLARLDQQPPLGWRVPGLVPDEGTCLWHGQPRDFKSMCAQALGLAMAANVPAFNLARFTPAGPVRVAYFTERRRRKRREGAEGNGWTSARSAEQPIAHRVLHRTDRTPTRLQRAGEALGDRPTDRST